MFKSCGCKTLYERENSIGKMRTILILIVCLVVGFSSFAQLRGTNLADAQKVNNFNHDYSQTLVTKISLSFPDGEGGSKVLNTFENAMEIIKKADELSLGVPKIVYLVGWQYNGHDDKYPAMFEVNKALKRKEDATARESLRWLMREAHKYNTTVSLHINMTDAYDNSPLWEEYLEKDLISRTPNGRPMVIGVWNDRKAYQINYKNEWESGYTQMRIDRLLELLPELKEAKTIHIDAWIARESKGHYETAITEAKYQQKALQYWNDKGIDVTSEWVMDYMIGKVPFAWHFNAFSQENYLEYPANVYTGSGLNQDLEYTDFGLGFLFGKSTYGQNVFPHLNDNPDDISWEHKFVDEFYSNCLQYFFLNKLDRIKVEGKGEKRVAYFSENVKVSLADSTVIQEDYLLREKGFVCFSVVWKKEKCLAIYSKQFAKRTIQIPENWGKVSGVSIFKISSAGEVLLQNISIKENSFIMDLKGQIPYLIKPDSINRN